MKTLLTIIVDVAIVFVGTILDKKLFQDATELGHPVPVFTVICIVVAVLFTTVMIVVSTIKRLRKNSNELFKK